MEVSFQLRGGHKLAYRYREPSGEMVLGGPAGTGKTFTNLLRLLHYGQDYAGARMLIVRKTRASLTESALVTWERNVLGAGHVVLGNPINRSSRHQYVFPNGSVLVTGGMDKPDKILSTEWDMIYVPEATDLNLLEWETLSGRLRAGAGPYDLIFGDCNPTTPTHWIYRRAKQNKLKLIGTTHRDNPRFFDQAGNRWTADGVRYLRRLKRMSGARRKRFLLGLWVAAEGLVYDAFDPAVHQRGHPPGWEPPHSWERVWGLDYGFTNPMSLTMWAVDPDGRAHLYREWYLRNTRVEALARMVLADMRKRGDPPPVAILGDHDPEASATFAAYTGYTVTSADKANRDEGIEAVQSRFDRAGDGRPRVYLAHETLAHPVDAGLADAGKPTCLADELLGYVWDHKNPDRLKDEPVKVNDHACDGMRYVMRWLENRSRLGETEYGTPEPPEDDFRPSDEAIKW